MRCQEMREGSWTQPLAGMSISRSMLERRILVRNKKQIVRLNRQSEGNFCNRARTTSKQHVLI
jgi:hypothetical protein